MFTKISLYKLIDESIQEIMTKYGKFQKLVDSIRNSNMEPMERLKWFASLPNELKKDVGLNYDGSLVDQGHGIIPNGKVDKYNTEIIHKIDKLVNNFDDIPFYEKLSLYKDIPSGKGNTLPYRNLIPDKIKKELHNESFNTFIKILRSIIDPVEFVQAKIDDQTYDFKAPLATSKSNKEIVQGLNLNAGSNYGTNKFTQTMYNKMKLAFNKICKYYPNEYDPDPYIMHAIKLGTKGLDKPTKTGVKIPYGYLLSLYYSEDVDKQKAFNKFIELLLQNNLFHAPHDAEQLAIYNKFDSNRQRDLNSIKKFGKYKKYIDIIANKRTSKDIRIRLYNSLPDNIKSSIKLDNKGNLISIDKELEVQDNEYDNDTEFNLPKIDVLNKTFEKLFNNTDESFKNDIIEKTKKTFMISDDEWDDMDNEEKADNISYYGKYHYNKNNK